MGVGDQRTFMLGATQVVVGLSALTQVVPGRGVNGWQFKLQTGAGTLVIANGNTAAGGFSGGYVVSSSEIVNIDGPATFFLAAGAATLTVGLVASVSAGFSTFP